MNNDKPFAPNEFEALRDNLGGWTSNSIAWTLHNGKRPWDDREIRHWMKGTNVVPVPPTVVGFFRKLNDALQDRQRVARVGWEEWRVMQQEMLRTGQLRRRQDGPPTHDPIRDALERNGLI